MSDEYLTTQPEAPAPTPEPPIPMAEPAASATAEQDIELQKLALERDKVRLDVRKTNVALWSVVIALATSFGSLWLSLSQSQSTESRERLDMLQRKFEDVQKQIASTDPVVKIAAAESLSFLGRERLGGNPELGTDDEFKDAPYFRQCSKMLSIVALVDKDPLVRDAAGQSGFDLERFAEEAKLPRLAGWSYFQWEGSFRVAQENYETLLLEYCRRKGVAWHVFFLGNFTSPPKEKLDALIKEFMEYPIELALVPFFGLSGPDLDPAAQLHLREKLLEAYLKRTALNHAVDAHFDFDLKKIDDKKLFDLLADTASICENMRGISIRALEANQKVPRKRPFSVYSFNCPSYGFVTYDIHDTQFTNCNFMGSMFGKKWTNVSLQDCALNGAVFKDVTFENVQLLNCDVTGAEFIDCKPEKPDLSSCLGSNTVKVTTSKKKDANP